MKDGYYAPTKKWISARVSGVGTWLLASLAIPGVGWRELAIGFIPLVVEAIVSYLTPNDPVVPAPDPETGPDPVEPIDSF